LKKANEKQFFLITRVLRKRSPPSPKQEEKERPCKQTKLKKKKGKAPWGENFEWGGGQKGHRAHEKNNSKRPTVKGGFASGQRIPAPGGKKHSPTEYTKKRNSRGRNPGEKVRRNQKNPGRKQVKKVHKGRAQKSPSLIRALRPRDERKVAQPKKQKSAGKCAVTFNEIPGKQQVAHSETVSGNQKTVRRKG